MTRTAQTYFNMVVLPVHCSNIRNEKCTWQMHLAQTWVKRPPSRNGQLSEVVLCRLICICRPHDSFTSVFTSLCVTLHTIGSYKFQKEARCSSKVTLICSHDFRRVNCFAYFNIHFALCNLSHFLCNLCVLHRLSSFFAAEAFHHASICTLETFLSMGRVVGEYCKAKGAWPGQALFDSSVVFGTKKNQAGSVFFLLYRSSNGST